MSATSSPSSQAEREELVAFAKAAQLQWYVGASRALALAAPAVEELDDRQRTVMSWMPYFQEHCLKGSPRATEILRGFRHHYTALLLTR